MVCRGLNRPVYPKEKQPFRKRHVAKKASVLTLAVPGQVGITAEQSWMKAGFHVVSVWGPGAQTHNLLNACYDIIMCAVSECPFHMPPLLNGNH